MLLLLVVVVVVAAAVVAAVAVAAAVACVFPAFLSLGGGPVCKPSSFISTCRSIPGRVQECCVL